MHIFIYLLEQGYKNSLRFFRTIIESRPFSGNLEESVGGWKYIPFETRGFVSYIFVFLLFIGLGSCDSNNGDSPVINLPASQSNSMVEVSQNQYEIGNLDTGRYVQQSFEELIRTTGRIDVPPKGKAQISAYFEGYVRYLDLIPGQRVNRGQTLFTLENPAYIEVQQNYLEVKNSLDYLKREYERQRELVTENFTSEKNYLKAESEYRVSISKYESLRRKLEMMHINPDKLTDSTIQTTIGIVAPISGFVTTVNASKGMFLSPGDIAMTLINTNQIQIELSVYESDLHRISEGQDIRFKVQSDLSTWYNAEIYLINRIIDESTRSVQVLGRLLDESISNKLTPGMFIEAEIVTQKDSMPALPEEAVVKMDDKFYVLVWKDTRDSTIIFEQYEVELGSLFNGYYPLYNSDDFTPETIFLVKGRFGLMSE